MGRCISMRIICSRCSVPGHGKFDIAKENDLSVKIAAEGKSQERKVCYGTGNHGTEGKEKSGI